MLGTRISFDDLTLQKRSEIDLQMKKRKLRAVLHDNNRAAAKKIIISQGKPLLHIHSVM